MDLVAKILSPTRPLRVRGRVYWVPQHIPFELKLKAGLIQQKKLEEFRFFGMIRRNSLTPVDPALDEKLRTFKLNLFQKYPDSFLMKNIRAEIKTTQRQMNEQYAAYSILDSVTLESYTEKHAAIYILCKLMKVPYLIGELLYYESVRQSMTITQIRQIARSDRWQNLYKARNPFKTPLTDEQIALSSFTQMYSNIAKHPECPESPIIEDDDLLDGWLIYQSKKAAKKQTSFGSKIDSAKEVFVMANNQDHANEIYSNNSDEARAIQNVRMKQLKGGPKPFSQLAQQR